jgi:hypothetical protein
MKPWHSKFEIAPRTTIIFFGYLKKCIYTSRTRRVKIGITGKNNFLVLDE